MVRRKVRVESSPASPAGDKDELVLLNLEASVREMYESRSDQVPFHGWHHIAFVRTKAAQFAHERGADTHLVEAAALVHDLNYLVRVNSEPSAGRALRVQLLHSVNFPRSRIQRIEKIIDEAHTATRTERISLEGSALSDADTLFKALPMTPVVFSHLFLEENKISLRTLGEKILGEQLPLVDSGIYFYDESVRDRYLPWAQANLELWKKIVESLADSDVQMVLESVGLKI